MFDTEEELYKFINDNLEKFKKNKEYLIRLGNKRGLLKYVVNQLRKVHPSPKWVKTMSPHIIIVRFDSSLRLALNKVLKFSLVLFLYGSSIFI